MGRNLVITLSLIAVILAYVVIACFVYDCDQPRFEEVSASFIDIEVRDGREFSTRVSRQRFVGYRLGRLGWVVGRRLATQIEPCFRPMAHLLRKWNGHPGVVLFHRPVCNDPGVIVCSAGEFEWTAVSY
jgi:hypothetical protein